MKKRLLSTLLALCLVLTMLPTTAVAATSNSGTCGDNISWFLQNDGTLVLTGTGTTPVFGGYWFADPAPWSDLKDQIRSIRVDEGITGIDHGAFESCTSAVGITLPASLQFFAGDAWPEGSSLQWVITGTGSKNYIAYEGILYANQPATYEGETGGIPTLVYYPPALSSFTSYTVREGTCAIGDAAFAGNSSLTSVTLPDSVKTIGYSAFKNCVSLNSIQLGDEVNEIGAMAFSGCSSLRSITFPNSLSTVDASAFWLCDNLSTIIIPASTTTFSCDVYLTPDDFYEDSTQHKDFYFRGNAPADFGWPSSWVKDGDRYCSIRTDIYYPRSASGWEDIINQYSNELTQFIAYDWEMPKYTLSYNLNGGSNGPSAETYTAGSTITLPTTVPTKSGYTFAGWSNGTTTYQPGQTFIMPEGDITLTAVWKSQNTPIFDDKDTYVDALISHSLIHADAETKSMIHNAIFNLLFKAQYRPTRGPEVSGISVAFTGSTTVNATFPAQNKDPYVSSVYDSVLGTVKFNESAAGCFAYALFATAYTYGTSGQKTTCNDRSATGIAAFIRQYADPGEQLRYRRSNGSNHSIVFLGESSDGNGFYYISYGGGIYPGHNTDHSIRVDYWSYTAFAKEAPLSLTVRDTNKGSYYAGTAKASATTIKRIVLQLDCPIEATVTYGNEVLDSRAPSSTNFGSVTRIDETIEFDMEYHLDYDLKILGTGNGKMTLTLNYYIDDNLVDFRKFVDVPIESSTKIQASGFDQQASFVLYMTAGSSDQINTWGAEFNETVYVADEDYSSANNSSESVSSAPSVTPMPDSSSSSPTTYSVTIPAVSGGSVTVSPESASMSSSVTVTAAPDPGYELTSLTVTGSDGKNVELLSTGNNKYTFTMPNGKVTVNAVFSKIWSNPFTDVAESRWYYDAVKFVNQSGLMNGVGNGLFSPNANLSRAMLAEILYNKEGRPAVTATSSFSDVTTGAWYANAVAWAAAKGIVVGYGNDLFGPGDDITREQFAVILYRYAGSPVSPNLSLDFTDAYKVSDWAQNAIHWAVDQGILNGKGNGILDPNGKTTRAEAAQMLKNYLEK